MIYLHQREFVDSFVDDDSNWAQKINANGIDELERLESEASAGIDHSSEVKSSKLHDFFICHASEDKKDVARPLAEALHRKGLNVWYDEFSLQWGRNLMKTIGKGISESRFGIVIFSPNFFEKKWAQLELNGLVEKLNLDNGELLPLLYNMTHEELKKRLLLLSGILCRSWDEGLEQLVDELAGIATGRTIESTKNKVTKAESIFMIDTTEFDFTLDKFTENGIHHIGIRNAGGKTIQAIMIFCNEQKCAWWDTGDFSPRHLYAGGGWNAHLPRGFANTDPMITVKSGDKIIAQTILSKIVRRPSEKWTAKDEDTEYVDRLNIAVGRIRSNLGTLQSLFEIFLGYPNNMPMTQDVDMNIEHKNELVENTQLTANQASHVLEIDWLQRINDLCTLAKKHPYAIGEKGKFVRCEHCVGIISQIESLFKDLPNSPI